MKGRLVICPTPLGNMEDVTLRALRALRECDVVFAEDTRVSRKLLNRYGIRKPMRSFHERVEASRLRELEALLAEGKVVAAVTDAGMPGISDPGSELVRAAREAGAQTDALPGPTALIGALVLSGFDVSRFRFEGFPPRKRGERLDYLRTLVDEKAAIAWYEAPTRALALLEDLETTAGDRRVFVLREYTKKFEQQAVGTAAEVRAQIQRPPRGEFTVVLEGSREAARASSVAPGSIEAAMRLLLGRGVGARLCVDALRLATGAPKNALYDLAQRLERE